MAWAFMNVVFSWAGIPWIFAVEPVDAAWFMSCAFVLEGIYAMWSRSSRSHSTALVIYKSLMAGERPGPAAVWSISADEGVTIGLV